MNARHALAALALAAVLALPACGGRTGPAVGEIVTPEPAAPAATPETPAAAPETPAASPTVLPDGNPPGGPDVKPPDASEIGLAMPPKADAIEKTKDSMKEVEGEWKSGEETGEFTVHVDDTGPRYCEEKIDKGGGGMVKNEYYYEGGELFFFRSLGNVRVQDASGVSSAQKVEISANFAGGKFESGQKVVEGKSSPLDPTEAQGILARAGELAAKASK